MIRPTLSEQSLLVSENLTLPSFQVIVMNASLGCQQCLQRVSKVISKMTGSVEYTVDVGNKRVIVKGDLGLHCDEKHIGSGITKKEKEDKPLKFLYECLPTGCFGRSTTN